MEDAVAAAAVAGIAGLAAAAWGFSKWLRRPDPQPECQDQMIMLERRNQEGAKWERPQPGWLKLNTDGSARKKPYKATGPATAGGLIRDHQGVWVAGFTEKLQDCDSVSSELQAIRLGLQLAMERGCKGKLEVETDCDEAWRLITDRFLDLQKHKYGSIVSDCRKLMNQLGVGIADLRVVDRSQNKCADRLTTVPPGKTDHVWDEVMDLPQTHIKNFNDVYMDDMNKSAQPGN